MTNSLIPVREQGQAAAPAPGETHEIRYKGEMLWRGNAASMNLIFTNLSGKSLLLDSTEYPAYVRMMEREANRAGLPFPVDFGDGTIELAVVGELTSIAVHRFEGRQ